MIQWNLTPYELGVLIRALEAHRTAADVAGVSTGVEYEMTVELRKEALELVAEYKRLTSNS